MKKTATALLALTLALLAACPASAANAYLIPDSNTRRLTEEELWLWQYDALGYVLNEIFARHGYHFEQGGQYQRYFQSQDWYHESTRWRTNQEIYQHEMNSVEWYNERLVKDVRQQMRDAGTTNPGGRSIYDAQPYAGAAGELSFTVGSFAGGQKLDVYSGPGYAYLRGANGRASVSTNDTVYLAGTEGGWALVLYETNSGSMRAGYVDLSRLSHSLYAQRLSFAYASAHVDSACPLTDDPVLGATSLVSLRTGASVTYLAPYTSRGRSWAYVEAWAGNTPVRGFVPAQCVALN